MSTYAELVDKLEAAAKQAERLFDMSWGDVFTHRPTGSTLECVPPAQRAFIVAQQSELGNLIYSAESILETLQRWERRSASGSQIAAISAALGASDTRPRCDEALSRDLGINADEPEWASGLRASVARLPETRVGNEYGNKAVVR